MKVAIVRLSYDVRIVVELAELSYVLALLARAPQVKHEYTSDKYAYSYAKGDAITVEVVERDEIADPDGLVSNPKTPF